MVDNRTSGVFGIAGGINFKSGDISGTAAKTSDDRASQGTEYFLMDNAEQREAENHPFVDRSMELRATLNSLALMNVASLLQTKRRSKILDEEDEKNIGKYIVPSVEEETSQQNNDENNQ